MDTSYRTPLLELFERGEVPSDIRLMAARGALAPRAHEQLALLVLLSSDGDELVAATAKSTLNRIPRETLGAFLNRDDVPESLRAFFRARGIEVEERTSAADSPVSADEPLVTDDREAAPENQDEAEAAKDDDADRLEATAQRLMQLPVAQRMKRAMLGTREERGILIRDTNRLIAACVLSSPKLTQSEVESFARMVNVAEDVLRTIARSRAWMKSYSVVSALALNPKTPIAVSLGLVPRLVERDIKIIMRDRNMPEPVRAAARRVVSNNEMRRS